MIRIHGAALDVAYLRRWAGELGVDATLETELGASGVNAGRELERAPVENGSTSAS